MLEEALAVLDCIPMYVISNLAPAGAFNEKLPSMSVTVPVLVPTTLIEAPIIGLPSSEAVTLPEI